LTKPTFSGTAALHSSIPHAHDFWSWQLVFAAVLNFAVQAIQIGAYAARLAGVQMNRIATSISLFNLFVTASRLANMFYSPMLGSISDKASAIARRGPAWISPAIHQYELQLRLIIIAGTLGTIAGALLLPVFLHLYRRGIAAFERFGSVPRALLRLSDPAVLARIAQAVRTPRPATWARFRPSHVPVKLIIANVVVTAVYAVGVVAAAFASILDPHSARTALLASGLVNGIATISFTLIVDPTSAFITDQAVRGERPVEEVKSLVFYLSLSAVAGTLLSQAILYPAAAFIGWGAGLINR
jgi:hypothetical protein